MSVKTKIISYVILGAMVLGQMLLPFGILTAERASAQSYIGNSVGKIDAALGASAEVTSVPEVLRFDWHRFKIDLFQGIMRGIAYKLAQTYMNRFVNKLTEKYKIRNFLYYDQVLSNYYLGNYLRDKIQDPDLRYIYQLMDSAYVTGQDTRLSGQPNPQNALIPRLKQLIYQRYLDEGGIPTALIDNPDPATIDRESYLKAGYYYAFNNPGFTEVNLNAQYGHYQSSATTAAQLEIIVGNGLKAGRLIGGYCEIDTLFTLGTQVDPTTGASQGPVSISTPQDCQKNGGVWKASALDQARSFIDNPTAYVNNWMTSQIDKIISNNYDPTNFWFVIGNSFGQFLTSKLFLDSSNGGVLPDGDSRGYTPSGSNLGNIPPTGANGTDIDGDGVEDFYDYDNDGVADICIYGGTAPTCTGSASLTTGGGTTGGTFPPLGVGTGNSQNPPPTFDINNVTWGDTDVSNWSQTSNLQSVSWNNYDICYDYDTADTWTPAFPLGGSTSADQIIGNAWIFTYRNGGWQASTFEWFRPGQTCKGIGNMLGRNIGGALNGAGMDNFRPQPGEMYGFMVSTIARNGAQDSNGQERSNVVMQVWLGP